VTYVDAFLRLTVTPQIHFGKYHLPERGRGEYHSELRAGGAGQPRVDYAAGDRTQVLVTDGGTVVIGGVIQTQELDPTSIRCQCWEISRCWGNLCSSPYAGQYLQPQELNLLHYAAKSFRRRQYRVASIKYRARAAGLKNLSGPAVSFLGQYLGTDYLVNRAIDSGVFGYSGTRYFFPFRLFKLTGMNFLGRQEKLREYLATTRFDALLISHLPNIRYLVDSPAARVFC